MEEALSSLKEKRRAKLLHTEIGNSTKIHPTEALPQPLIRPSQEATQHNRNCNRNILEKAPSNLRAKSKYRNKLLEKILQAPSLLLALSTKLSLNNTKGINSSISLNTQRSSN